MAIFSKDPSPGNEPPRSEHKGAPAAPALSIVGAGMTVHGDLESSGVVKVEGVVDGGVKAQAQVLVAKGGVVHGDIETTEVVVGGVVNGAIRASGRVEVQAGASVQGDITTSRISVAEGGSLNGLVRTGNARPAADDQPAEGRQSDLRSQSGGARPSPAPVAHTPTPPPAAGQSQAQQL